MEKLLQNQVNEILGSAKLTAAGIGVLRTGGSPTLAVCSRRYKSSAYAVESNDRWHIGSITKSITATLIASQISRGNYGFDTPVSRLLEHIPIHQSAANTTVKQLLTNSTDAKATDQSDRASQVRFHGVLTGPSLWVKQ